MGREDLVEQYMCKYPVLHFSFNGVKGDTYSKLINCILTYMKNWCIDNGQILDFSKCNPNDVASYNRIQMGVTCPDYKDPVNGEVMKESDMEFFLTVMIQMLFNTHGEKVVVLQDEYDVPLAKASVLKHKINVKDDIYISAYDAMKGFIAGLFAPALKDNVKYLERSVVTGCMRIAQASIFTGINNFSWYGIQRAGYADAFGKAEIYCPWDVLEQVKHLQVNPEEAMEPHWLGTSENEALRQMLRNPEMDIEEEVSGLLLGGTVPDGIPYQGIAKREWLANRTHNPKQRG